jgi:hypothetical protein
MGMFDTIQWGDNLPFSEEMKEFGLDKNNWSFQTKDLDCCLANYVVQDGNFFLEKYKSEKWVEGDPKGKSFMDRMGSLERTDQYLELQKITETIYMYDYRHDVLGLWDCTIEFKVVLIDGKVDSTELFEFKKVPSADRKEQEREWHAEREYENSRWYNRFIFHTPSYRWVRRILSRAFYKIGTFFQTISYKLP